MGAHRLHLPLPGRAARLAVAAAALVIALGLAACGSSSSSTSGANAGAGASQPGNTRRGFLQDPKVVACLKKQGVTLPAGRPRGNGGPPDGQNGQPPNGANGQPPDGRRSPNGPASSAQLQKLREALQKCGVPAQGLVEGDVVDVEEPVVDLAGDLIEI